VFFLATCAVYQMDQEDSSFISGIASGAMLIKPHLMLFTTMFLWTKARKKSAFSFGLLLALILPFAPFVTGYRPLTDLLAFEKAIKIHSTELFTQDDQNVASNFLKVVMGPRYEQEVMIYNKR